MIWDLVLLLASDAPDIQPRHVTAAGVICDTGIRCEPVAFDGREACNAFVQEHGRRWHRETGADVAAVCMQRKEGELIG